MKSFKMIKSHSTLSLSIALNISAVIPDGPGAVLFFICSSACSISFRVISCSRPSVVFSSSNVSLAFSLLSSSSKYDFHLSLIASSSVKILPLLCLIMFTACLSIFFFENDFFENDFYADDSQLYTWGHPLSDGLQRRKSIAGTVCWLAPKYLLDCLQWF